MRLRFPLAGTALPSLRLRGGMTAVPPEHALSITPGLPAALPAAWPPHPPLLRFEVRRAILEQHEMHATICRPALKDRRAAGAATAPALWDVGLFFSGHPSQLESGGEGRARAPITSADSGPPSRHAPGVLPPAVCPDRVPGNRSLSRRVPPAGPFLQDAATCGPSGAPSSCAACHSGTRWAGFAPCPTRRSSAARRRARDWRAACRIHSIGDCPLPKTADSRRLRQAQKLPGMPQCPRGCRTSPNARPPECCPRVKEKESRPAGPR